MGYKSRRKKRLYKGQRRELRRTGGTYWYSGSAVGKACSHCGKAEAVALRPRDHRYACPACIDRLNINAQGNPVTVRHVDPATLRRQP